MTFDHNAATPVLSHPPQPYGLTAFPRLDALTGKICRDVRSFWIPYLTAMIPHLTYWIVLASTLLGLPLVQASEWINYPPSGYATMTHYTLPENWIAACGCTANSTHYPTAAMSQMAFGSSTAYGPGCGRCFNLTLVNTFTSNPPFYPPQDEQSSVVVKVTDLCPLGGAGWCSAMPNKPNA